jgi:hypothetical protein
MPEEERSRSATVLFVVLAWALGVGTGLFFGMSYSRTHQDGAPDAEATPPTSTVTAAPAPSPTPTPTDWVRPMHVLIRYPCCHLVLEQVRVRDVATVRSVELTFRANNDRPTEDCRIRTDTIVLRDKEGRNHMAEGPDVTLPRLTSGRFRMGFALAKGTDIAKLVIGDLQQPAAQLDIELENPLGRGSVH